MPDDSPAPRLKKIAYPYSGTLSSIANTVLNLFADDAQTCRLSGLLTNVRFKEFTVKCRTIGTNTYIALGNAQRQDFRFTAANQSYTYEAPTINGETILLRASDFTVIGDVSGGAGILEISGIEVIE